MCQQCHAQESSTHRHVKSDPGCNSMAITDIYTSQDASYIQGQSVQFPREAVWGCSNIRGVNIFLLGRDPIFFGTSSENILTEKSLGPQGLIETTFKALRFVTSEIDSGPWDVLKCVNL